MKFLKGMVLGTIVSTGVLIMMADNMGNKTIKKTGKKFVKKLESMMD